MADSLFQALYIRDLCSSHGTWLNNLQLITEEKTLLVDGDTLRFGVDINHGDGKFSDMQYSSSFFSETLTRLIGVFPALSVRCEIDWSTECANPGRILWHISSCFADS